ncbi:MAG: protein kinase [Planctomycetota bacterium]
MPTPAAPQGTPFGRYVIERVIGHGGMGVVYRAWDTSLCRTVALKTLLPGQGREDQDSQTARFLREARSAGRLKHPNVIAVFDVGQHEGRHFFTMELVEGVPLDKWIAGTGRPGGAKPGFVEIARLLEKAARALRAAHEGGIVHRDVKPSNLLIDAQDEPHLGDFGLAKAVDLSTDADLTVAGALLGTPQYMSPEQAGGEASEIGPASDVYSLGSVLYFALTGTPPFEQPNLAALLRCVLEVDPSPPSKRNPRVPRDIEAICLKALEKEPARRYASALELAEDLARYVAGTPVLAHAPGTLGRLLRLARRHRWAAGVGGLVLASAVIAGVVVHEASGRSAAARTVQEAQVRRTRAQDLLASVPAKSSIRSRSAIEAALPRLTEACQADPTFAVPYRERGYVQEKLGRFDEALADYTRAAELDPTMAEAHYRRGCMLLAMTEAGRHDSEGAREAFRAAGRASPGSLYADLGDVHLAMLVEDWARAQGVLDRLAALPDRHADVFFLRASIHSFGWNAREVRDRTVAPERLDLEAALADLDVGLELDPLSAWGRATRGLSKFSLGDLEGAREDLEESARLRPNPDIDYASSRVAYLQGDIGSSRACIDRAVTRAPKNRYRRFRALLEFYDREYQKGLDDVDSAVDEDPSDSGTLFVRGVLRFAMGNREGAASDVRTYRGSRPDHFDKFLEMDKQIAKNRLVLTTVSNAFREVDRILFLPPEKKKALRDMQRVIGAFPWFQEGMQRLREAARSDPETAGLLLSVCEFVEDREELAELPAFLTKELGIKNQFIFGSEGRFIAGLTKEATLLWRKRLSTAREYVVRAAARYRRGETAEALLDAEEAARLAPGDADALYAAATLRAISGKADEAIQALTQAFAAGWGHPEFTRKDPDFASIAQRPEFRRLVGE